MRWSHHLLLRYISNRLVSRRRLISNLTINWWIISNWWSIGNWWSTLHPLNWLSSILYCIRKCRLLRLSLSINLNRWNYCDRRIGTLICSVFKRSLSALFISPCSWNRNLLIIDSLCFCFILNKLFVFIFFLFDLWRVLWMRCIILTFLLVALNLLFQ